MCRRQPASKGADDHIPRGSIGLETASPVILCCLGILVAASINQAAAGSSAWSTARLPHSGRTGSLAFVGFSRAQELD